MKYSLYLLISAALAVAAPSRTLQRRADICGDTDTIPTGGYTVNNNLWNTGTANPGGSQCSVVDSLEGSTLAWNTSWTWQGNPDQVKSYANAQLNFAPKPLSAVNSLPSTWSYSLTPGTYTADISYDIFTDASTANTGAGDHHDYEIMIWLADLGGAKPIATSYDANGAVADATGVQIAGTSWSLYSGESQAAGGGQVFSFIASSQVTNFNGDLLDFLKYLQQNKGLNFAQNLVYVAAGMEAFTGSNAVLTTTAFSAAVN